MNRALRRTLGRVSLGYYRWTKQRHRAEIVAAFMRTGAQSNAPAEWVPLSQWLGASPSREHIMMMVGPRWNTAAILALTPMFEARARITVDTATANAACLHWTAVVYDANLNTAASVGSRSSLADEGDAHIDVPPGRYFIALRCYEPGPDARFPAIWVDGKLLVEARAVGDEPARYARALRALRERRRFNYRLMHYHVYAMLRERRRFDEATLRRHYLPAGNPETEFAYGAVASGDRVGVSPATDIDTRTYITFYGIDSVPCAWQPIDSERPLSGAAPEHGTFLVRRVHAPDSQHCGALCAEPIAAA